MKEGKMNLAVDSLFFFISFVWNVAFVPNY